MSLDRTTVPAATLVLPVYNAEAFLGDVLDRVRAWLSARPEAWELVVVDDASTDRTPDIVEGFVWTHPEQAVFSVRFTANRGKGFAIRAGLGVARGRYAVFTDCDLAYPVRNIGRILAQLEHGADAAIACRVLRNSTYLISPSFFSYLYTRHLMGRLFNLLCRAIAVPHLLDTQAGLKGFRTEGVRGLLGRLVMDGFSFDAELLRALLDRGARIAETPVSFRYDSEPSTVRFVLDSLRMFRDLVRIRVRSMRGCYRSEEPAAGPTRLVLQADDFGLAPGVNHAIQEDLVSGALTSASIMMGTPHARAALAWAAAHPRFDYGVHLNLTRGRPILSRDAVPSLVTRSGEFPSLGRFLVRFLIGRVRLGEVDAEWHAQLEAVRSRGVVVSHLDSHQHVHLLPWLSTRVAVPLARDKRLALRAMDGPFHGRGRRWDLTGLLLFLATRASLRRGGLELAAAHGFGLTKRPTLAVLRSLVSRMKPGRTYELVVHPGFVDAELRASGDGYLEGREKEQKLLTSEEFRAVLRHAGLELRDMRHVLSGAVVRKDAGWLPHLQDLEVLGHERHAKTRRMLGGNDPVAQTITRLQEPNVVVDEAQEHLV